MTHLSTPRLLLKKPSKAHALLFSGFEKKNKTHFSRYTPLGLCNESLSFFQKKLEDYEKEFDQGISIRFFLFEKEKLDGPIIGSCNFTQIFRGVFHACYLGYRIDQDFQGKGLMQEALKEAISYMFHVQNLHRIMANYIPSNGRSEKLLIKLGFVKEGYAKQYLYINGQWEDHILTSLTNPQWRESKPL